MEAAATARTATSVGTTSMGTAAAVRAAVLLSGRRQGYASKDKRCYHREQNLREGSFGHFDPPD